MEDKSLILESNTMDMSNLAENIAKRTGSLLCIAMDDATEKFEVDASGGKLYRRISMTYISSSKFWLKSFASHKVWNMYLLI